MSSKQAEQDPADLAIRVSDVTKCFQVYAQPQDRLKQAILPRLSRFLGRGGANYYREFWALKGINFEVRRGDTVGIIGRNGSGKSTLLQIICGTLQATTGEVAVRGRVAALLELGAGFNPEFTGRENVYMSASILGLTREQIDAKYDDIVAFADIGDFLEQPVKTYSSGMYVRLAFAVIAHVDADILVIDEALAVGDAIFVQKCMRFLRKFRENGTLLFVSHDTSSVLNFCQSAVWLDRGEMRMHGTAQDTCNAYIEYCSQEVYGDTVKLQSRQAGKAEPKTPGLARVEKDLKVELFDNVANSGGWQSGVASIDSVTLFNDQGEPFTSFAGGEDVVLKVRATAHQPLQSPLIGFFVKDRLGQSLFGEHTYTYVQPPMEVEADTGLEASFRFTLPLLPNGEYSMTVSIADGDPYANTQHAWLHDAVLIRVASPRLRYGLVGIPFDEVTMKRTGAGA
ncbi:MULTISPECIES: ABC transporter ATP-binding protein [Stenotrophomonas]|jgi:lipopolysaccharide transport system ATP-binding protein|uniref:ABC transporter ATP-binding protein n=1 Tax=Stenotrophomonas TaxID=40323 RepID=UPI000D493BF5|nr:MULTISPECIES: ABC transporter ATP-binding protein [Stenotrophomonas]PTT65577.1 ABC transporter ATP-binding protein [Stenotrophomonas sp. HMWF003]TKK05859.1 ABC transporter ATP-binding protein [Stenotrophomonas rhizophila]